MARSAIAGAGLIALTVLVQGCGGGSDSTAPSDIGGGPLREPAEAAIRVPPLRDRVVSLEHLRRAVLHGVGRDYLGGTQVGPPSFGLCLQRGMRSLLHERNLRALALVYRRPAGQQFTAQALTDLAAPIGSRCGGRRFVPMLIEASMAFRTGRLRPVGVAARLARGPQLGVACRQASSIRCDRVGIDLVLRRRATAVTATLAGRKLRLRTADGPGVAGRSWTGHLDRAGLGRPGSPLYVSPQGGERMIWGGYPPVFISVGLEISHARGGRTTGVVPRVSLEPERG